MTFAKNVNNWYQVLLVRYSQVFVRQNSFVLRSSLLLCSPVELNTYFNRRILIKQMKRWFADPRCHSIKQAILLHQSL